MNKEITGRIIDCEAFKAETDEERERGFYSSGIEVLGVNFSDLKKGDKWDGFKYVCIPTSNRRAYALCKYANEVLNEKIPNNTHGVFIRQISMQDTFYNGIMDASKGINTDIDGILLDHVTVTGFQAVAQGNIAYVNLSEEDRAKYIRFHLSSIDGIQLILKQLESIYYNVYGNDKKIKGYFDGYKEMKKKFDND